MSTTAREFRQVASSYLARSKPRAAMVPAELVAEWVAQTGETSDQAMIACLPLAQAFARAEISGFAVGAVAMGRAVPGLPGQPGNLYFGANLEVPGQAPCFTLHAEQSAVNNARLQGEQGLQALAVTAETCGFCRQFLCELAEDPRGLAIITAPDGARDRFSKNSLADLLPAAFGPSDLGRQAALMHARDNGLCHSSSNLLVQAALTAANASYAPYTGNFCGVALRDQEGKIHVGQYAENAASNPALLPMISALGQIALRGALHRLVNIAEAVLLEANAGISQVGAAATVLSAVAPAVALQHVALPG